MVTNFAPNACQRIGSFPFGTADAEPGYILTIPPFKGSNDGRYISYGAVIGGFECVFSCVLPVEKAN